MKRTLPLTTLGFLTLATLAASTSVTADDGGPGTLVHQYFNEKDGNLTFTDTAPLVRNPAVWTTSGTFNTRDGLHLEIPIANAHADDVVLEDNGTHGWISYHTSVKSASSGIVSCCGPGSGTVAWKLVEGSSSSRMLLNCRNQDTYYCEQDNVTPAYVADFPGHGADARPHTHGNDSNPTAQLLSGEFSWLLTYTIPACTSIECDLLEGSTYQYTFSVDIDGTTFVEYRSGGTLGQPVAPSPSVDGGNTTVSNATAGNATASDGGNGTASGNSSANSSADGGVEPHSVYIQAREKAPGVPLVAAMAGVGGVAVLIRRRRSG